VAALALALANFHPVAIGWDPAEYVWAVEANLLPHAPYLGYYLLGELVSLVMPVGFGLSLLSTLAFVGIAVLLPRLLRRTGLADPTPLLATLLFLSYPVCMRQAGIQEVYAVLVLGVLASLLALHADGRGRTLLSGALFALTATVHFGALLVLPAFLCRLVLGKVPGRVRRLLSWCLPSALFGPLVVLAVWMMLRPYAGPGLEFAEYFRGIGMWSRATDLEGWLRGGASVLTGFFRPEVVGLAPLAAVLALCGLVVAARRPLRVLAPWLGFAAAYTLIEAGVGRNVDPGLYAAYLALPVAVFSGLGLSTLFRALQARSGASPWVTALLLAGLALHVGAQLHRSRRSYPGAELAAHEGTSAVRASRWIAEHTDPDAIVVEPRGLDNANLLPGLHRRRPILLFLGNYHWFEPYGRWSPIHPAHFRELTDERLARLIAEGETIVALDRELEAAFPTSVRLVPWERSAGPLPFELYRAVAPEAVAAE